MKPLKNKESESYPCVFTDSLVKKGFQKSAKSETIETTRRESTGDEKKMITIRSTKDT